MGLSGGFLRFQPPVTEYLYILLGFPVMPSPHRDIKVKDYRLYGHAIKTIFYNLSNAGATFAQSTMTQSRSCHICNNWLAEYSLISTHVPGFQLLGSTCF